MNPKIPRKSEQYVFLIFTSNLGPLNLDPTNKEAVREFMDEEKNAADWIKAVTYGRLRTNPGCEFESVGSRHIVSSKIRKRIAG